MNNVDAGNRVLESADRLRETTNSFNQASDTVAGTLNSMGMTNAASSVSSAAQQASDATESVSILAVLTGRRLLEVAEPYLQLSRALRYSLCVKLAEVGGMVSSDLKGRQEGYWRGAGARAYTEVTDIQVKAASELSSDCLIVADEIENALLAEKDLAVAINTAIITLLAAIIVALATFLAAAASVIGLPAIIALAIAVVGAVATAGVTAFTAYSTYQAALNTSEQKIAATMSSDGDTAFSDNRWPSRELYSKS